MDQVNNTSKVLDENAIRIKKEISEKISEYHRTVNFMLADAPLSVLCLPKYDEKALCAFGCLRVYDLFDLDFTKVEGLSKTGINRITTSLNKLLAVS